MGNNNYSDSELVSMIQGGKESRELALRYIYQNWQKDTKRIVLSQNKNVKTEDAEDAIGEGVIEFDKKVRNPAFTLTGTLKGFFINLCKNKNYTSWRSKYKSNIRDEKFAIGQQQLEDVEANSPENILLQKERQLAFEQIWNMQEPKCRAVLLHYRLGHKSAEIAELVPELGNANNARQWVKTCRERLTDLISKSSYFKK